LSWIGMETSCWWQSVHQENKCKRWGSLEIYGHQTPSSIARNAMPNRVWFGDLFLCYLSSYFVSKRMEWWCYLQDNLEW
jgi:hypothetical protein